MATNPWDAFPAVGQQAPQTPQTRFPGIIQGAPEVKAPPAPPSGYRMNPDGTMTAIPGGPADPNAPEPNKAPSGFRFKPDGTLEAIPGGPEDPAPKVDPAEGVGALVRVIDQIDNIYADSGDNNGWFETGLTGQAARGTGLGGTAGFDLAAAIQTIDANMAFDALQRMRDASPTGGALGQVTEKELALLKSTIANIDPDQSQEQFIKAVGTAKGAYLDMLRRLDPEKAAEIEQRGTPRYDDQGNITYDERSEEVAAGLNPGGGGGPLTIGGVAQRLGEGAGSVVQGVGDIAGIAINPVGQLLYDALGYDQQYDTGAILREASGLPANPIPLNDAIIRGGTAALAGAGAARAASTLTNPGVAQNALNIVGRTPIRDTAAGAGAGAGMVAGERSGVPGGEVAGALVGGLAGYGGANALARLGQPRQANALLQSADDMGVSMMPADVGGTGTRMATGATGASLGGIPLAEGAQRSIASAGRAARRTADTIGDVTDPTGAGQDVARGFGKFAKNSAKRAEELYSSVSVPAETKVQLDNTRTALLDVTEGFASNPELSQLWAAHPRLRATLEALAPKDVVKRDVRGGMEITRRVQPEGGELSWQDMKRFRSIVGEIVGQPGVSADGSDVAGLRKLYAALSQDMEATAAATSPRALQEFRRASQFWRGRQSRIDDVFATLLGPDGARSPEKVFRQINNWAKIEGGDFGRLARTIRSLPEDEANTVRATIVHRMGLSKPRNQEGAGDVFSPKEFAAQWQGMSTRAKAVLFPDKQHRQDLDKLATVMDGMKRADQYANYSRTALGVNSIGQGALALTNLPVAVALAAAQFGAGKLLASPRVARWLASAPKTDNPAAVRRWTENLGVIASREPALQSDIQILREAMGQAANENPAARLAAEDQNAHEN